MKKYPWDKITLAGLFIGSLLIARLIIASKSTTSLTGPIELDYSGLSVSMPTGGGWNTQKQWIYKDSSYMLSSICMPTPGGLTDVVYCRYLINAEPVELGKLFEQKAAEVGGQILKKDQLIIDEVVIDFVHIGENNSKFDMFFGVAGLPYERRLEIEVRQTTGDAELAQKTFKGIIGNLKFKDNHLLEAGSKVVSEIKSAGLVELLKNTDRLSFFNFTDMRNRTSGFTMDEVVFLGDNPDFNIQTETFLYVRQGRYAKEQTEFFQSSNNLDRFMWKYSDVDITGTTMVEIMLEKNGPVTVKKSAAQSEEKKYQLGSATIPEGFLDLIFNQMLTGSQKKIMIDIIESEGQIIPLLVSRIAVQDSADTKTKQEHVFEIKLLDGSDFSEQVFLDEQNRIFRKLLAKEQITLERTSLENIVKQFPEKAGYIRQKAKTLEKNQL
jgi:hypothetical protein